MQKTFSNTHVLKLPKVNERKDFPGGSVGKNLPAKVGTGVGLIPGLERFHTPQSHEAGAPNCWACSIEPVLCSRRGQRAEKSSYRSEEQRQHLRNQRKAPQSKGDGAARNTANK